MQPDMRENQDARLFTVSFWRKLNRPLCTFDICVPDIASYLDGEWTEDSIRDLLTDIPGRDRHHIKVLVRGTQSENRVRCADGCHHGCCR